MQGFLRRQVFRLRFREMLKNTFCHINGIGEKSERKLWDLGILRWDDAANAVGDYPSIKNFEILKVAIEESRFQLELRNPKFLPRALAQLKSGEYFQNFVILWLTSILKPMEQPGLRSV